MKTFLTFLIICFVCLNVLAQEKPVVNIGTNFPLLLSPYDFFIYPKPGFYIEKPLVIYQSGRKNLSVNPGFAYFNIHETLDSGHGYHYTSRDVDHRSVSFYLKLIRKHGAKNGKRNWYYGAFSGIHLYSSSKGDELWESYFDGTNPSSSKTERINQSGRSDFYHLVYYGALIGIERNLKKIKWLRPGFEFKIMPHFAEVDYYSRKKILGAYELTLNLGFTTKSSEKN